MKKEKKRLRELFEKMNEILLRERGFADVEMGFAELVGRLNTNHTYLYKAVKACSGMTFQDYLQSIRLEEARRLLDSTDEQVTAIALMSGYKAVRTFYRHFREHYRLSPSKYRYRNEGDETDDAVLPPIPGEGNDSDKIRP